jgi:3-hydroxy-9,10-secoandrosta-1,3,5(10)-triene-9,17-dione monooxygenase reductase component
MTGPVTGPDRTPLSSRDFRRACGHFLTGVTIVTARSTDGAPIGLTVNSFTSVSLEPPLVLVCIDRRSGTYPAFAAGSPFAVHVLRHDQRELSTRFATPRTDKFADVRWHPGIGGAPVLSEFTSLFECTAVSVEAAGDHGVFLGRVDRVEIRDSDSPLAFYRGAYVRIEREGAERIPDEATELWRLGWA